MDTEIAAALEKDKVIDITTSGRKSGQPRRIEIWFHNLDGSLYISGLPGRRDWYANMQANTQFTFHLKKSVTTDIPAVAVPIIDAEQKRSIISQLFPEAVAKGELEHWVKNSPLVEVTLRTT